YPGFLTKIIVPGKSFKKILPYCTRFFIEQAMKQPEGYKDAYQRLMQDVAFSIGGKNNLKGNTFNHFLDLLDFNSPFKKQAPFKEAFLTWTLNTPNSIELDLVCLYNFIKQTKYIVTRETTIKSLIRRHDQWVIKYNSELKKKFPEPWVDSKYYQNEYSIIYISCPSDLIDLALSQKNCVDEYLNQIYRLKIQIYMMQKETKPIATIGVLNKNGKAVLGKCLGKKNSPLNQQEFKIIEKWFQIKKINKLKAPLRNKETIKKLKENKFIFKYGDLRNCN
ncbi:MAG: PcfJ domain-containing protein, partial [Desulfobacula sp.]|nr:PcfJ domain-containing protein [Desulfobacula sp.]